MKTLIASFTLIAGPLAAHPFHAAQASTFSVPVLLGAIALLAAALFVAKRAGLGQ